MENLCTAAAGGPTSAAAILGIPASRPELLFTGDEADAHLLYHRLAAKWHPDRNRAPEATGVFQHIVALHAAAKQRMAAGCWRPYKGERLLTARDGRQLRIKHHARLPFELGELLIGSTLAAFLVAPDAADLYASALRILDHHPFASGRMRRQILPCLPRIRAALQGAEHCALVVEKPDDMVLLKDLVEHLGGTLPVRHVAWIVSRLCNLTCYLQWARLTHNAIAPDTVFVSPRRHAIALLGGWWYAARAGERLTALPQRTVDTVPRDIVDAKVADPRCDLELVRATGRELLGDASGVRLKRQPAVPQAMADWLTHPSSGSALSDYRLWCAALNRMGPRRFARLDLTPAEIYPITLETSRLQEENRDGNSTMEP